MQSFFLQSILIISWDPAIRSESEPFAWAEKLVQQYKDLYPELYLDYVDLHQDVLDFKDTQALERLHQAQIVCLVLNDEFICVPKVPASILSRLSHWDWSQPSRFLFTKKVQPVFTDWTLINSQNRLTKELSSLEDKA